MAVATQLKSPGTLFNMVKKAKTAYLKGAKPNLKDEAELRYAKILEDLRLLRDYAKRAKGGADLASPFEVRRKVCYKKLKEHFQKLKRNRDKDEYKAQLPRFLKTLGIITLAIKGLTYADLDDGEDESPDIDNLEDQDLTSLDTPLESDPDALVDEEGAVPDAPSEEPSTVTVEPSTPPKKPSAPPPIGSEKAKLMKRLNGFSGDLKALVASKSPELPRIQALLLSAKGLLDKDVLDQAKTALDALEPMIAQAKTAAPPIDKVAVQRRLMGFTDAVKAALANKSPDLPRIQTLFKAATGLLENDDPAQADKVLDELEEVLGKAKATPPKPVADERKGQNVLYTQARLLWDAARKRMQSEVQRLEEETIKACEAINNNPDSEDEIDIATVTQGVRRLHGVLDFLDDRLLDKLDDALNAADPDDRKELQGEAKDIVKEYLAYVSSSPLMKQIDDNGIYPVKVKESAVAALSRLASML